MRKKESVRSMMVIMSAMAQSPSFLVLTVLNVMVQKSEEKDIH